MSKQAWTIDKLTAYYTALADVSGAHMQRIVDWAVANDRFIESEAEAPLFSIAGKKRNGRPCWLTNSDNTSAFIG